MAGHSKWANIKHKKAKEDAKRGKIFTKLIKEITVAVKVGGGDIDANPRLRLAVANAKKNSVPKDNIERAIKKGSGDGGDDFVEMTFEGYGPDGVGIFVEAATDNNIRTVSNIKNYFNKNGGSLGKDGCLQFVFEQKSIFTLPLSDNMNEDDFTLEMIDAGAEEIEKEGEMLTIIGAMESFGNLQKKLDELSIEAEESGLERIPLMTKEISEDTFLKVMKLIEILEDDDDIQKVYHNIEFKEEFEKL